MPCGSNELSPARVLVLGAIVGPAYYLTGVYANGYFYGDSLDICVLYQIDLPLAASVDQEFEIAEFSGTRNGNKFYFGSDRWSETDSTTGDTEPVLYLDLETQTP